jgi:hypothetical protein
VELPVPAPPQETTGPDDTAAADAERQRKEQEMEAQAAARRAEQTLKEQALKEQALKEQALREQALKEQALKEQALKDQQQAEAARRLEAAAAQFYAAVKGTWTRSSEDKDAHTSTKETLVIDAKCSGVLTTSVTTLEKGFAGWKPAGPPAESHATFRCDGQGNLTGNLSGQLTPRGEKLVLGPRIFDRTK